MTSGPTIVNIVAAGSFGQTLDLAALTTAIDAEEVSYGADDYNPAVIYVRRRATAPHLAVYKTGRYHLTGASTPLHARAAVNWFSGELNRIGVAGIEPSFAIANVMAQGKVGTNLDLYRLWTHWGSEYVDYDPECHPALMYYPERLPADFRLLSSGTVQLYVDSPAVVGDAFEWIHDNLLEIID